MSEPPYSCRTRRPFRSTYPRATPWRACISVPCVSCSVAIFADKKNIKQRKQRDVKYRSANAHEGSFRINLMNISGIPNTCSNIDHEFLLFLRPFAIGAPFNSFRITRTIFLIAQDTHTMIFKLTILYQLINILLAPFTRHKPSTYNNRRLSPRFFD